MWWLLKYVTQVAHKGSDKALFPNVLCLLGTRRRHVLRCCPLAADIEFGVWYCRPVV